METFIRKNIGFFVFYLVLIGGMLLINVKFSNPTTKQNNIIAINK